jgi:hypothetical protein
MTGATCRPGLAPGVDDYGLGIQHTGVAEIMGFDTHMILEAVPCPALRKPGTGINQDTTPLCRSPGPHAQFLSLE